MEICGGQTHAIMRYGLDRLLPKQIRLIHGPGCPVCVTPIEIIDRALELARNPKIILTTFGDMLRVPGSNGDLMHARAEGADIRIVYSPQEALILAHTERDRQVVFFAIGFETSAPGHAAVVYQAHGENISNFSILTALVMVPPAIRSLLDAPDCSINGFLAAGHVCTVSGYRDYENIASKYKIPIVVTGFEPVDILLGVYKLIELLESGRSKVINAYARAVQPEGNQPARRMVDEVFQTVDRRWRGLGFIKDSGLDLKNKYSAFDAVRKFTLSASSGTDNEACISGQILTGRKRPDECPCFGNDCTPEHPLGATMVSSEGACAAYYSYRTTSSRLR